jgi:hypothetical protein
MENMYYIGLDVHKKTISYCVKDGSGRIRAEGAIPATRWDLDRGMKTLPAAVDSGDRSHHLHRWDLRSSEAPCSCPEGGASADAACHRRGQEEKRSHRCPQDCRLGDGTQAPDTPVELFQGWREITNSIFCDALQRP